MTVASSQQRRPICVWRHDFLHNVIISFFSFSFLCIILSSVYLIYFYVSVYVCCLHWRINVFIHKCYQWKTAVILPIPKTASPTQASDFRSISITPVLSHTLERLVVRAYIYPALLQQCPSLDFSDQFSFRPSGSTTAAIVALLHTVLLLKKSILAEELIIRGAEQVGDGKFGISAIKGVRGQKNVCDATANVRSICVS